MEILNGLCDLRGGDHTYVYLFFVVGNILLKPHALFFIVVKTKIKMRWCARRAHHTCPIYTMDLTELNALVSFMIVHHPIPALPVVCGRGEGLSL